MAKVLLTTMPLMGHINPAIPVARALKERGHDVLWYCDKKYDEQLKSAGVQLHLADTGFSHDPFDFTVLGSFLHHALIRRRLGELFVDWAGSHYGTLERIAENFKPDIVLTDCLFPASLVLARKLGIPGAVLGVIPYPPGNHSTAPYGLGLKPAVTSIDKLRNRLLWLIANKLVFDPLMERVNAKMKRLNVPELKEGFFEAMVEMCDV